MKSDRNGAVLIAVVFTTLLLAALTSGVLVAVTHAREMADTRARLFVARAAAESAVAQAVAGWDTRRFATLAAGASQPLEVPAGTVEIIRLDGATYLLEGTGIAAGARARVGAFVRALQLRELWLQFPAALTSGAAVNAVTSTISTDSAAVSLSGAPGCPAAADSLAAIHPGGPADVAAAENAGAPERFGPLPLDSVITIADRVVSGTVDFAPGGAGLSCDASADGTPAESQTQSTCAEPPTLIFAPGDLIIRSGSGRGVLVVGGNLAMLEGTRFTGPVLVRGETRMNGARIDGALTTGTAALRDASVSYRACEIERALTGALLSHPMRRPGRWWIPQF